MSAEREADAADATTPEAQIRALEASRIRALVAADRDALQRLHAADYQLITPSGRAFSRERYVGLIASGAMRYLRWEPGPMEVRVRDDMALVRYRVMLQLGSPDGAGTPRECWHTDSYERIEGRWQAVWSQATAIAPDEK